ncbi:hypothetical protein HDK77DRAFT_433382 [Phyllosticta capitalensis]
MADQEEAGGASEETRSSPAILVSKPTATKNEGSKSGISNKQMPPPVVKIANQVGQQHAAKLRNGVYRQFVMFESTVPFSVQTMMNIDDGPMTGCEAMIVKPLKGFRFLELPREIRDRIYTFAIRSERTTNFYKKLDHPLPAISPYDTETCDLDFQHQKASTPGLLQVSRQVHAETMPILYGQTRFILHEDYLEAFLETLGRASKFVKSLRLWGTLAGFYKFASLLLRLVNLKRLELDLRFRGEDLADADWEPDFAAAEFYNIATSWILAVGRINENRYAAADIVVPNSDMTLNTPEWNAKFRSALRTNITNKFERSFPLLKLPRNVRLMIYEFAMTDRFPKTCAFLTGLGEPRTGIVAFLDFRLKIDGTRVVKRSFYGGPELDRQRDESLTPGLLRTSRLIYHESLPILYSRNTFFFYGDEDHDIPEIEELLEVFFNQIGRSASYIQRFGFERYMPGLKYLATLLQLRELFVPLSEGAYDDETPENAAKNFYERERQWIEGVSTLRRDRLAVLRIISPTIGDGMHLISTADNGGWMPQFRAELQRLLLQDEPGY